jgi:hypothetical protein
MSTVKRATNACNVPVNGHPNFFGPSRFFGAIPNHFKALNQNETRISNRDQPKVKNRFCKSNFNLELEKFLGWSKKIGMVQRLRQTAILTSFTGEFEFMRASLRLRPALRACVCVCLSVGACVPALNGAFFFIGARPCVSRQSGKTCLSQYWAWRHRRRRRRRQTVLASSPAHCSPCPVWCGPSWWPRQSGCTSA